MFISPIARGFAFVVAKMAPRVASYAGVTAKVKKGDTFVKTFLPAVEALRTPLWGKEGLHTATGIVQAHWLRLKAYTKTL